MTKTTQETLNGTIERITFYNKENGFTIFKAAVEGAQDVITLVASAGELLPGEDFSASGQWVTDKRYGKQFKVSQLTSRIPHSKDGIIRYLSSGVIKGIGTALAQRLVEQFGDRVFDVIEKEPEKLEKIFGKNKKKIEDIQTQWKQTGHLKEVMFFLQDHGVAGKTAAKITHRYGDLTVRKIQNNPYQLIRDIQGIGFKIADQIAKKVGIAPNSQYRIEAALEFILTEALQRGHCGVPEEKLIKEAEKLIGASSEEIKLQLQNLENNGHIMRLSLQNTPCVYLKYIYHLEQECAKFLNRLNHSPNKTFKMSFEDYLQKLHLDHTIQFNAEQLQAIQWSIDHTISIITGGPGTGKSTLTKAIVNFFTQSGAIVTLCSPTGRAAKRLSECTSTSAKTIHRLLKFDPQSMEFVHHKNNPLSTDVMIVDETSMLDIRLAHALIQGLRPGTRLILIGDKDQLPSIGPGLFLFDLIKSKAIATTHLTKIYRQQEGSRIIEAAALINQGKLPPLAHPAEGVKTDFYYFEMEEPEQFHTFIANLTKNILPKKFGLHPLEDIQVLCPMQKGEIGAKKLNEVLQKTLNPDPLDYIEWNDFKLCVGDKIIINENNYEKDIFNGDIGIVAGIDKQRRQITLYLDGKNVILSFDEVHIFSLAYTISIHKAQGSEYPAVIIPISIAHYILLRKNLLYTAVTRGKKLVILLGELKAILMAVKNQDTEKRWTNLANLLN